MATWLAYLVAAIEFVDHGHLGRFLARLLDGVPLRPVAGSPQPGLCERRHDDGVSSSKSEERRRKRGVREEGDTLPSCSADNEGPSADMPCGGGGGGAPREVEGDAGAPGGGGPGGGGGGGPPDDDDEAREGVGGGGPAGDDNEGDS